MAKYFTDFSEYPTGQTPDDWRDSWITGGHSLIVRDASGAMEGKVLEHRIEENDRRAWAWDRVPRGAAKVEILTRMRSSSGDSRFGIIARGDGEGVRSTEQGVTCEFFKGSNHKVVEHEAPKLELRQTLFLDSYNPEGEQLRGPERPHGVAKIWGESFFPWVPGKWFWLRLQVEERDGYLCARARAWDELEPDWWHYDVENIEPATVGANGWVGITGQRLEGVREYDFFSVGTEGDSAPLIRHHSR